MNVILLRHGESSNNQKLTMGKDLYALNREQDPDLSDKGTRQVQLAAQYLENCKIQPSLILCSPHLRAIQSAKIISEKLKVPIQIKQMLHEVGGCHLQGVGQPGEIRQQFLDKHPSIDIDSLITEKGWFFNELKESQEQAIKRGTELLESLIQMSEQMENQTVIIITHGNLANLLLKLITNTLGEKNSIIIMQWRFLLLPLEFRNDIVEDKPIQGYQLRIFQQLCSSLATFSLNLRKLNWNQSFIRQFLLMNILLNQNSCIIRTLCHSIHINLAFEQYLFKNCQITQPLLFLWSNDRNVVIGRHQNPWKECNLQLMEQDQVKLSRRNSGGGAVYQDLGNHCFTFISPLKGTEDHKSLNNQILLDTLQKFGVQGETSGRNDIQVNGRKVSGSAYQLSLGNKLNPNRLSLHHGTMLISCNFQEVGKYLNPSKKKLISKGVDSVIQRVINLSEVAPQMTTQKWADQLGQEFRIRQNSNINELEFTEEQMLAIPEIKATYDILTSRDWLYDDIPEFSNNLEEKFSWGLIDIYFNVKRGIIVDGLIYSDCLYPEFITAWNVQLKSASFSYSFTGISQICTQLRLQFESNQQFIGFIDDLEGWLLKSI